MRLIFVVALAALLISCGGSGEKPSPGLAEQEAASAMLPGTAAWNHGALKLPEGTPAVLQGRLDRLGEGAVRLKNWLIADPAMFGEDGESLVRDIEVYWAFALGYFGGEIDDPMVWRKRGIDPERAFYAGVYPVGPQGMEFLKAADDSIRTTLGAEGSESTLERLLSVEELGEAATPTGFNGELQRSVQGFAPLLGIRFVVPVAEPTSFGRTFLGLMDGLELRQEHDAAGAQVDSEAGSTVRIFSNDGDFPVIRLEVDAQHAVVDLVTAPVDVSTAARRDSDGQQAMAAMLRARHSFPSGRPAAPAPLDDPALTVSFHQPEMARLSRLRRYRRSIASALKISASERDAAVLEGLIRAERLASNWWDEELGFSGLTYTLHLRPAASNRIASVEMTFTDSLEKPELVVRRPAAGLGVENRSVGASFDFAPLFAEPWQAWLGVEDPLGRMELWGIADGDPLDFFLTMPRNVALAAANVTEGGVEVAAPGLGELLATELPNILRAEVAATSPDLSSLATEPHLVTLFLIDGEAGPEKVEVTARAARDFVITSTASLVDVDIETSKLPELTSGWSVIELDGLPTHRVSWTPGSAPQLLVTVGLEESESEAELEAVVDGSADERDEVVFLHVRPSALVELISADEAGAIEPIGPINPPMLAQRLGPLLGWVKPRQGQDSRSIQFVFELQRPPKL